MTKPKLDRRLLGAAAALAILISLILSARSLPKDQSAARSAPVCVVGVEGDVAAAGLYLFAAERVSAAEAVRAAGGALDAQLAHSAELDSLYLASGQSLFITVRAGDAHATLMPMDAAARLALGGKLNLNTASEPELLLIPQMKADTAKAICDRRASLGRLSLEDLQEIRGIGPKTVARWSEYLEVPQN